MKTDSTTRLQTAIDQLEKHAKSLGLMNTDYGKAIIRIKVEGFDANLEKLTLTPSDDAAWTVEAISLALAAFQRAQSSLRSPNSDGVNSRHLDALERAVQILS